jgi:hypothetical protein
MRRLRVALLLAGIASLVIAASALAAKVTGGTTTITPSSVTTTLLANNHITVTPTAPATASNGAFTFPVTRGRLNTKTLHGRINQAGGVQLSNGTSTVVVRHPVLISTKRGAYIWALVRGQSRRVCTGFRRHHPRHAVCLVVTRYRSARILKITSGSVSGSTFSGNVAITQATADVINRLAGKTVVAGGAALGTISIAPTLSSTTTNS